MRSIVELCLEAARGRRRLCGEVGDGPVAAGPIVIAIASRRRKQTRQRRIRPPEHRVGERRVEARRCLGLLVGLGNAGQRNRATADGELRLDMAGAFKTAGRRTGTQRSRMEYPVELNRDVSSPVYT